MPPSTLEALWIFLLFLPGFLALKVLEISLPRRTRTPFGRFLDAAALSLIAYAFYAPFTLIPWIEALPLSIGADGNLILNVQSLILMAVLAVFVGALISRAMISGLVFRGLRRLGLSSKTGRRTVWEDAFAEGGQGALCLVRLANGRKIYGWVRYYSEDPENLELLVTPHPHMLDSTETPRVIIEGDGELGIDAHPCEGVLITSKADIEQIDFISSVPIDWGHERKKWSSKRERRSKRRN